jgi:hypothetical protein
MELASIATYDDKAAGTPLIYLLLAFITGSTAVVDLFFWAPLFASFSSFQTCRGGGGFLFSRRRRPRICKPDYIKGFGRLFVSLQCLVTGFFYATSALVAYGTFTSLRDEQKVEQQVKAMQRFHQQQQQKNSNTSLATVFP